MQIRRSGQPDLAQMSAVINDAAQAYKGIIPADRWHEPYMPMDHLKEEIAEGVRFWGYEQGGELVGVMGVQDRGEVELIRHAYVKTAKRNHGIGGLLLEGLESTITKPILIGTWAAATWAIEFYRRNGFTLLTEAEKERLLRTYWSIPERQIATSVVLADRKWMDSRRGPPSTR